MALALADHACSRAPVAAYSCCVCWIEHTMYHLSCHRAMRRDAEEKIGRLRLVQTVAQHGHKLLIAAATDAAAAAAVPQPRSSNGERDMGILIHSLS